MHHEPRMRIYLLYFFDPQFRFFNRIQWFYVIILWYIQLTPEWKSETFLKIDPRFYFSHTWHYMEMPWKYSTLVHLTCLLALTCLSPMFPTKNNFWPSHANQYRYLATHGPWSSPRKLVNCVLEVEIYLRSPGRPNPEESVRLWVHFQHPPEFPSKLSIPSYLVLIKVLELAHQKDTNLGCASANDADAMRSWTRDWVGGFKSSITRTPFKS